MSIAVLREVHQEVRRLAIAGSGLAPDDFRLRKLVAPLAKVGEKAPVFAKVAEAVQAVVDSGEKTASGPLLDLSTLVTAILYTQGKTGHEGDLRTIETEGLALPNASAGARTLKPLIEALTTTGSGRQEIIEDAHKRGAFYDVRLVRPALAAIDDPYPEIGEFVCRAVLPIYGRAIVPMLRASLNLKGRGGQARRVKLLHGLDPEGAHELIHEALESGSKEIKLAALACLKGSRDHLGYIAEQARSKSKDVRRAAFDALAEFDDDAVVDVMMQGLKGGDLELIAGPASENPSRKLLDHLIETAREELDAIETVKDKAKLTRAIRRLHELLVAFSGRDDKQTFSLLEDCFAQREAIAKRKGTTVEGGDINDRVAALMVRSGTASLRKRLIEAHATLPPQSLAWALVAALATLSSKQVFKLFSPYYLAVSTKKRGSDPVRAKQEAVSTTLYAVGSRCDQVDNSVDDAAGFAAQLGIKLDKAWLDAALDLGDLEMVDALAQAGHRATRSFLKRRMDDHLAKSADLDHDAIQTLATMIRVEHPQVVDYFVKALQKSNKRTSHYYTGWLMASLIKDLPKKAVPKIEAALPTLSERVIDQVLPHLEMLKAK